jgi:hypothetical protein
MTKSLLEPLCSVQKYILCSVKPRFWLKIVLSGIINCNTFSVVPSIINENAKNVQFHCDDKKFYSNDTTGYCGALKKLQNLQIATLLLCCNACCSQPGVNVVKLFFFVTDGGIE